MFERFTDDARQAVVAAAREARRHRDGAVSTPALVVGVASVAGVGKDALTASGVTVGALIAARDAGLPVSPSAHSDGRPSPSGDDLSELPSVIEGKPGGRGPMGWRRRRQMVRSTSGHLPFTPGAKQALELGLREAIRLDHDAVGTGAVLLGLLRVHDELVEPLLVAAGGSPESIRTKVLELLHAEHVPDPYEPGRIGQPGLDHVTIEVADLDASRAFYDAVLEPLGLRAAPAPGGGIGYGPIRFPAGRQQFWLRAGSAGATARRLRLAFVGRDRASIQAFRDAAVAAGAPILQEPRAFPENGPGYWAGIVGDPDGNEVEAVCRHPRRGASR